METLTAKIILSLLLPLILGCTSQGSQNFREEGAASSTMINGLLQNGDGETVLLEEMTSREFIPVDTVLCDESGNFHIEFQSNQVAFYVLRFGPSGYLTLLMEPGESVDFTGRMDDLDSYTIKGSQGSELLQTLAAEHKRNLEALGEIARLNMELRSSPDYKTLKQHNDLQFDSITSAFHDYSTRFIHDNAGSPAILIALYNLYGQGLPVFQPNVDFAIYQFVDSALMAAYSDLEAVQLLHAQVTEAKQLKESEIQSARLKKGEIAPDFVSSRPDGSQMALSDLKGNYVLLSFWASWSKLCREENASLVRAQKGFEGTKFRILQVSVDDDKAEWTAAIEKDQLNWDHVSDLKRWDTPPVDLYGVEKIPFNVIIDPAGKIVDTDLYGEQLLSKLDLLLNN